MTNKKFSFYLFGFHFIYSNLNGKKVFKIIKKIKKLPGMPGIKTIFIRAWDKREDNRDILEEQELRDFQEFSKKYDELIKQGYDPLKAQMIIQGEQNGK